MAVIDTTRHPCRVIPKGHRDPPLSYSSVSCDTLHAMGYRGGLVSRFHRFHRLLCYWREKRQFVINHLLLDMAAFVAYLAFPDIISNFWDTPGMTSGEPYGPDHHTGE